MSPRKSEIPPFSKAIFSPVYNGCRQMTTVSYIRAQYLQLIGAGFFIFVLVFLCHVTSKSAVSRSRPSVPYGANFLNSSPRPKGVKYCVCMPICSHISKTLHVNCGRGSVLLWRDCNALWKTAPKSPIFVFSGALNLNLSGLQESSFKQFSPMTYF